MTSEFDADSALDRRGERWHGELGDRWHIRRGPNGGFVAALLLAPLLEVSPFPDPLTMTTHYLSPPELGPFTISVETLRQGRSHATFMARLEQDRVHAVAVGTFGTRRADALESVQDAMPSVAGPDGSARRATLSAHDEQPLRKRLEQLVPPELAFDTSAPGRATVGGWTRFPDRPLDTRAVPLFMDCWPPAMFFSFQGGFAPTLELTVHFRSRPHTEWHLALFTSRFLIGGYVEEDGLLWGEDGRLVAQSRQLALFHPPDLASGTQ